LSLSADGGGKPAGRLAEALMEEFCSLSGFQDRFSAVANAHMGSGWAWFMLSNRFYSLPNEDLPLTADEVPILELDLWEHTSHLQHQAAPADYIEAFWNIMNCKEVGRQFEEATRS
jgi:Fe-Mn family superoxide dismutase